MIEFALQFVRNFFEKVVGRFYIPITIGAFIISALAVWVIATKWNINSDFKALLPENAKAAIAMTEVGDRVGSGSALFVVIDSPSTEANKKFAKVYAEEMRKMDSVALAHYHNDKEFFEKNALLYMEAEDIAEIRKRLKKRIREEKKAANPLFISLKKKKRSDNLLEVDDIQDKYKGQEQDTHKEYLIADDGYSLTIVVRFVESSTDLIATNKLLGEVEALGERLKPKDYHPDMTIELGGGLVNRKKEYNSILDDVVSSAVFTIVGLFLVIALYFRRLRAIVEVLVPLIMGILWTLALAFLFYGELTTVTAFIFAILLGLGIDFSIHLLSGYDHERIDGHEPVEALVRCYQSIGFATVIGAFTTFVTFVVLSFAQFRGLSQFGAVASAGVICSIIAMCVVLPALTLVLHKIKAYNPTSGDDRVTLMDRIFTPEVVQKKAIPMIIVAVLLSVFFVSQWGDLEFEENFRAIGTVTPPWVDKDAMAKEEEQKRVIHQARVVAKHIVFKKARDIREATDPETFVMDREQKSLGSKYTSAVSGKQSSTPTIMLFDDANSAEKVYSHMNSMHKDGRLETIRSLSSIHAFMPGTPEEQAERLEEINKIRALLDKEGTAFMTDKQKNKVEEFRDKLVEKPVTLVDLPEWTKRLFKEAGPKAKPPAEGEPYAFEYLIYINESIDQMKGGEARRFLTEVATVAEETGEELRIGSQSYIYTAMLDEIKTDGLRMMLWAVFFVFIILTMAFRSPLRALTAATPLVLGAMWMFGALAWFGIRLDFFNVIIIPVVIGIGVDDGVHFYYRYLDRGRGSVPEVIHHVGSAVLMTSVTSCIGFGGLAITNHRGLQSIGYVAIAGILSALVATVLILPAIITLAERYDIKWIAADAGKTAVGATHDESE